MFNIVLYQPEIPPNTGNIMRLCINAGFDLHFIQPLGFVLNDKRLRRAGLDYAIGMQYHTYRNFSQYEQNYDRQRFFLCTTKAHTKYSDISYQPGDSLIFGPETRGLPAALRAAYPQTQQILIPMQPAGRSLNLATAVGIIAYEAWRQNNYGA